MPNDLNAMNAPCCDFRPDSHGDSTSRSDPFGDSSVHAIIHSIEEGEISSLLRKSLAKALRDARHRLHFNSLRSGTGFGGGWKSMVDGVECYVFQMFGVELGSFTDVAGSASASCFVVITDPEMTRMSRYGRHVSRYAWNRKRKEAGPSPKGLFEKAYAAAINDARGCGEFVWRRDAIALANMDLTAERKRKRSL